MTQSWLGDLVYLNEMRDGIFNTKVSGKDGFHFVVPLRQLSAEALLTIHQAAINAIADALASDRLAELSADVLPFFPSPVPHFTETQRVKFQTLGFMTIERLPISPAVCIFGPLQMVWKGGWVNTKQAFGILKLIRDASHRSWVSAIPQNNQVLAGGQGLNFKVEKTVVLGVSKEIPVSPAADIVDIGQTVSKILPVKATKPANQGLFNAISPTRRTTAPGLVVRANGKISP